MNFKALVSKRAITRENKIFWKAMSLMKQHSSKQVVPITHTHWRKKIAAATVEGLWIVSFQTAWFKGLWVVSFQID